MLGARWPFLDKRAAVNRARSSFQRDLCNQSFKAIVLDYDGTLVSSHRTSEPPTARIVDHLERLSAGGIRIGIASGRGDSIRDQLRSSLSPESWKSIHLGLYNCGLICSLADELPLSEATSEFLSHVTRIIGKLKALGVPIKRIRTNHPYQVSVRFFEGVNVRESWFAIADSLRQAGLDVSRVVFSKHSVDIISAGLSKSHLVGHLIDLCGIHPYEILTVGDQGAWPGNDCFLLEHRFSLSVDSPSRRLDRGWKLAPAHTRDIEATIWYLDRLELRPDKTCGFDPTAADSQADQ